MPAVSGNGIDIYSEVEGDGEPAVFIPCGSFVLLVLSTVLGIFHTVIKTVTLDVRQWLICTAVALSIVLAAEIRKTVLRAGRPKIIHPRQRPQA